MSTVTRDKKKKERYREITIRFRPERDCWRVCWPKKAGARTFKDCESITAARAAIDQHLAEKEKFGRAAQDLTAHQRVDAAEALKMLAGAASLVAAARCYLKYNPATDKTISFGKLNELYLDRLFQLVGQGKLQEVTAKTTKRKLNAVARDLGDLPAQAIGAADLDKWLDEHAPNMVYAGNIRRALHTLFRWGIDQKYLSENPVALMESRKPPKKLVAIMTPDTARKFMATVESETPELSVYYALQFFGGLRPSEAQAASWKDMDWTTSEFRVMAMKTHQERLVHVENSLLHWLATYRKDDGPVAPPYGTLRKRHAVAVLKSGVGDWVPDWPRHSFATYHLAKYNKIDKTCMELGHTGTTLLFKHYAGLAQNREAQAKSYFGILPATAKVGNVIQIGGAAG